MYLEFTKQLALEAGQIIREGLTSKPKITAKGRIDLVTDTDKASERHITTRILEEFPNHQILAEEGGFLGSKDSTYQWVVDPLDGTTNFAHGFPFFSVSIALRHLDQTIIGAVYHPILDELFYAEKGKGSYLNDKTISVSGTTSLTQSLLVTGFPYNVRETGENLANHAKLSKLCRGVRRTGSAALDLCSVACGRLDGYWEIDIQAWDIAAGSLIVQEAGGVVSRLDGGEFNPFVGAMVAATPGIHQTLVSHLQT